MTVTERPLLPPAQDSLETTTPVVEIEEPLLSAPEVLELINQTRFTFILDGVVFTLFTEGEDPLAVSGDRTRELENVKQTSCM